MKRGRVFALSGIVAGSILLALTLEAASYLSGVGQFEDFLLDQVDEPEQIPGARLSPEVFPRPDRPWTRSRGLAASWWPSTGPSWGMARSGR